MTAAATTSRDRGTRAAAGGRDGDAPDRPGRWLDRPMASYYLLLGSAGLLVALGLLMVLSASSVQSYVDYGTPYGIFRKQVLWVALGLPALWLGLRLPVRFYRAVAYPLLIGSALMLMMVLVPGVGTTVGGSTRWLDLGPLWLQPAELAKLGLALWGADLLARKRSLIGQWKHLLVPLLPVAMFIWALVMLEPDLGTTLCMVLVVFGLLFFVGAPLRLFGMLGVGMVGLVALMIAIEPYRMERITSFMNPFADPQGAGFQAVQGIYSLASGGWWGAGLGGSTGKWTVPNAYTDYIFAIIGGDLGLVGCLVVLLIFAVFAYAGIRIARRSVDPFVQLVAGAVTIWLTGQALINIGYVVGLLPVTGIPLPLISFGGTSLVLTMFIVGMLASFARMEPAAAQAIAEHGRTRWARLLRLPVPAVPQPGGSRRTGPGTAPTAGGRQVPRGAQAAGRAQGAGKTRTARAQPAATTRTPRSPGTARRDARR